MIHSEQDYIDAGYDFGLTQLSATPEEDKDFQAYCEHRGKTAEENFREYQTPKPRPTRPPLTKPTHQAETVTPPPPQEATQPQPAPLPEKPTPDVPAAASTSTTNKTTKIDQDHPPPAPAPPPKKAEKPKK